MNQDNRWKFWVDRGGTFTDVVALRPDGELLTAKLLSEDPGNYDDATIEAVRRLTGAGDGILPPLDIRIGTTVATNALLERKGEPVVLAITRGFGDALLIGTQDRPDIFARHIRRPPPLYADVVEIDERVSFDGDVLTRLDLERARADLARARQRGISAVAIVLMHAYRHPLHEQQLAEAAADLGFTQISVSHETGPLIKLIGRGDTTVVDAYLSPVLRNYVAGLEATLGDGHSLLFMQSNGGLAPGNQFRGKDAILSGPAGGIVGMAETAKRAGFNRVIGFDMGGTSTDVSLFAGTYERDNETLIDGVRIRAPMLRIHTVAAGGGSICAFRDGRLVVGPESAGAIPGPACYRRGGPLTITDCNVALGKVRPEFLPAIFGADGVSPIDPNASRHRLAEVAREAGLSPEETAEGFIRIAVAGMANAIKAISVARGHDPKQFVLSCFGGAGGQHACLVADELGIEKVMIHPLAGVLSAYGMGLAHRSEIREATMAVALGEAAEDAVKCTGAKLSDEVLVALGDAQADVVITAHLRTGGGETLFEVPLGTIQAMRDAFATAFRHRFGYDHSGEVIIEMLRAEAIAPASQVKMATLARDHVTNAPVGKFDAFMAGDWHEVPVYQRTELEIGAIVAGPTLIVDAESTTVIEPGWSAAIADEGSILLSRTQMRSSQEAGEAMDPVRLEIFSGLFMAIAQEMGSALQYSATSVNIRERLDFSCALFDGNGNLVANAPHIPVHLGSMGESVRAVNSARSADGRGMKAGDVYALNDPYQGGTHLPDITVIQPVFASAQSAVPDFFVAARGHHADVGGISPGSMPPASRSIDEEGVIFDNVLLVEGGNLRESAIREQLGAGPWPARNIEQNIADLSAQVAACARGAERLAQACDEHGMAVVKAYMRHVQDHAARIVERLIPRLANGRFAVEMDSGAIVDVEVKADAHAGKLVFDFAGTSGQQPDNTNAPVAIVRAAVLYVLRLMIDEQVPLNDGFMRAVRIEVPEGCFLRPRYPAAVVAGNVETSQAITDALLGALGVLAGSQGTMNNFTFGNERYQYYETIAGGAGAGPDFDGTSAVQTHMTNSRLTDPEVIESRFPVLIDCFCVRQGSGGSGKQRGGDGAVRRIRFREGMHAGILSNNRRVRPFGLDGGESGASGVNRIERSDGSVEVLDGTASVEMGPGDTFVIETPGGGGFGTQPE